MIDIYIIITITSLFVLVVTLFFTDYQIRTLYITQQESKGDVVMENIKEDKYEIKTDEKKWVIKVTGLLPNRVQYSEAVKFYEDQTPIESADTLLLHTRCQVVDILPLKTRISHASKTRHWTFQNESVP